MIRSSLSAFCCRMKAVGLGMSGVTGMGLRESSYINRSLSALADVLGALAEHRSHVPYRNSKLTYLLQDSIGMSCVIETQKKQRYFVVMCLLPCIDFSNNCVTETAIVLMSCCRWRCQVAHAVVCVAFPTLHG